jgi:uroporphyrinogen III methyltransferase/synthase
MAEKNEKKGKVYLIGAGPGDPDLITVKGYSLLNSCDVIVYDNLIPHELIVAAPPNVKRIYVGKIADAHTLPQEKINELLVEEANKGHNVARLKGGDPFVFGRGGEEAEYLREHGIEFEVIPGITAGLAATASAGIPASHRNMSSAILLVTAHGAPEHDLTMNWDWAGKIGSGTVIGYMGVRQLPKVVESLIKGGMPSDTESAMIERCCFSTQKIVRAKLKDLPQEAEKNDVHPPAIFIIGQVTALADKLAWYDRKLLSNVRIMVTRPADQSRWIYQMLRGFGAEVQPYPTIKTSFSEDKEGWESLAEAARSGNSWLLFTSENGVRYFFGYLRSKNVDLRLIGKFRIAATGFGTLRSLNTLGYHPDFTPDITGTVPFAEKLCEDIDVEGVQIVRVRGKLPNDPVEEILKQAGAEVLPLTLYKTEPVKWQEHEIRRLFWHPPHMIMFTSGRSVDGLVSNLGQEKALELAKLSKIASIGPTTSAVLSKYNMKVEIEAKRHSIPDLINEIVKYYLNNKHE